MKLNKRTTAFAIAFGLFCGLIVCNKTSELSDARAIRSDRYTEEDVRVGSIVPGKTIIYSDTTHEAIMELEAMPETMPTEPTEATEAPTKSLPEQLHPENVTVDVISVSCLKVAWDEDSIGRKYSVDVQTDASYAENIYVLNKTNTLCYLTGLREDSEYQITVTPVLYEDEEAEDYEIVPVTVTGRTEAVEVIWDFDAWEYDTDGHYIRDEYGNIIYDEKGAPLQYEYIYNGCWTSCMAYERASGLTKNPSAGAIAGSVADPITETGIRRDEYGDYCVAMGTYFGYCGDRFLVEFDNGQQITVKLCDSKGDTAYHTFGGWGHCIIEMIHDGYAPPSGVSFTGNYASYFWNGLEFGNIVSIKKINYPDAPVSY